MRIDMWVKRDAGCFEYFGAAGLRDGYRRPSFSFENAFGRERAVYVAEIGPRVKIGSSQNPRQRILSLQKHGAIGAVFISSHQVGGLRIERQLLEAFWKYRLSSEYFDVEYNQVLAYVREHYPVLWDRGIL
jgi:hypothetical protein